MEMDCPRGVFGGDAMRWCKCREGYLRTGCSSDQKHNVKYSKCLSIYTSMSPPCAPSQPSPGRFLGHPRQNTYNPALHDVFLIPRTPRSMEIRIRDLGTAVALPALQGRTRLASCGHELRSVRPLAPLAPEPPTSRWFLAPESWVLWWWIGMLVGRIFSRAWRET